MADADVAQFTAITGATPHQAQGYLEMAGFDVEQAVSLFFESPDLVQSTPQTVPPASSRPSNYREEGGVVHIDSDNDDDLMEFEGGASAEGSRPPQPPANSAYESDEAMARRLQEEAYGSGGGSGGGGGGGEQPDVRAPIARTHETLAGPGSSYVPADEDELNSAVMEQLRARARARSTPFISV